MIQRSRPEEERHGMSRTVRKATPIIMDGGLTINTRKSNLSDVPPPDKDFNILGDVWSILVLGNCSVALDPRNLKTVLYFHPRFVSFRNLWWHVCCWRHGLSRRYDPPQRTTTIRRHTKLEYEVNTRKERETYLLRARTGHSDTSTYSWNDIVDRLNCVINLLGFFLRTLEISGCRIPSWHSVLGCVFYCHSKNPWILHQCGQF